MLDKQIIRVKVTADFACFTRPDLKVERMTYPCMTPSAARGVLDSILWKPEFKWYIRRILVLKQVKFFSIKRNEINSKQGRSIIVVDKIGFNGKPVFRSQRNSIILKDVSYIIEASVYIDGFSDKNPPTKYVEMFRRRVRKGQCWRRPYLGTRELSAEFMPADESDQPIGDTIPIGSMLFDIFYNEQGKPEPIFFYDVAVKNGILDCEVPENEQLLKSTHIQPEIDESIAKEISNLNGNELEVVQ